MPLLCRLLLRVRYRLKATLGMLHEGWAWELRGDGYDFSKACFPKRQIRYEKKLKKRNCFCPLPMQAIPICFFLPRPSLKVIGEAITWPYLLHKPHYCIKFQRKWRLESIQKRLKPPFYGHRLVRSHLNATMGKISGWITKKSINCLDISFQNFPSLRFGRGFTLLDRTSTRTTWAAKEFI